MEQRLLFNGVGGDGRYPPVVQVEKGAVAVLVHTADAVFSRVNFAAPLAGTAPYPRVRQLVIKHGLTHKLSPPTVKVIIAPGGNQL